MNSEDPDESTAATEPEADTQSGFENAPRPEAVEESNENEEPSLASKDVNYVQVLEPLGDDNSDNMIPVLWGRFWGMTEGNAIAFYWEFSEELFREDDAFSEVEPDFDDPEDDPDPETEPELEDDPEAKPDETGEDDEDPDEDENDLSNFEPDPELFEKEKYAIFGQPSALEQFDPGLRRQAFIHRLLDFSIDETPVPRVILDDIIDGLRGYLEKSKAIWLRDFIRGHNNTDIEGWFRRLLQEINSNEDYNFQLRAQMIDPTVVDVDLEAHAAPEADEDEDDEEEDGEETSAKKLDVSLMTDPTDGVDPAELEDGEEIYFRIVGDVEFLPEDLIDRDRQEPASTPMTGPIVRIENQPDIPGDRDADPKNYRRIEVKIEPEIHGTGLAFKDDRIKIPIEDDEAEDDLTQDLMLLGILVLLLVIIGIVIFFL